MHVILVIVHGSHDLLLLVMYCYLFVWMGFGFLIYLLYPPVFRKANWTPGIKPCTPAGAREGKRLADQWRSISEADRCHYNQRALAKTEARKQQLAVKRGLILQDCDAIKKND